MGNKNDRRIKIIKGIISDVECMTKKERDFAMVTVIRNEPIQFRVLLASCCENRKRSHLQILQYQFVEFLYKLRSTTEIYTACILANSRGKKIKPPLENLRREAFVITSYWDIYGIFTVTSCYRVSQKSLNRNRIVIY